MEGNISIRAAAVFGLGGILAAAMYEGAVGPIDLFQTKNLFWFLWVGTCAVWGGREGKQILNSADTHSFLEAFIRALIILCTSVLITTTLGLAIDGLCVAIQTDATDGLFKILMAIPYGPFIGILASFYTLWILAPIAVVAAALLYRKATL